MSDAKTPLPDAERFVLDGEEGEQTWVVLAVTELSGTDYALLAAENDLASSEGDMDVVVFEYHRDDEGSRLGEISDEVRYEEAYRELATLMGIEDAVDN